MDRYKKKEKTLHGKTNIFSAKKAKKAIIVNLYLCTHIYAIVTNI